MRINFVYNMQLLFNKLIFKWKKRKITSYLKFTIRKSQFKNHYFN